MMMARRAQMRPRPFVGVSLSPIARKPMMLDKATFMPYMGTTVEMGPSSNAL